MTDAILQMRGITKTFPGVTALQDVNLTVRRGEIHAICGENGAGKSTLMKVLSGVYPHGSYDGEIIFDGEPCQFAGIRDSEHRGIVIIHQELALCPQLSIAENIFLGNEQATPRLDRLEPHQPRGRASCCARVGLRENPVTPVDRPRRRQAAAGRDRQGAVQGGPAADPRRADRRAQRRGLRAPARPAARPARRGHHLRDHLAQAQRDRRRSPTRITILRDGRTIETLDMRADDVTEDRIISGMVGRDLEHRFPPHEPHDRRGGAAHRGLDRAQPHPARPGRGLAART